MPFSPRGRHIWITGASSGIGAALALRCAKDGAESLIISARRQDRLDILAQRCRASGATVHPLSCDLSEASDIDRVLDLFFRLHIPLDTLVHSAGVSQRARARDTELATASEILAINFSAVQHITRELLPTLMMQDHPHLVAISSIASIGVGMRSSYAAAKAALEAYMRSIAIEEKGLCVSIVKPGFVRTAVARHALRGDSSLHNMTEPAIERGMSPERCARAILRCIGRTESYVATPLSFHLFRLMQRLHPTFARSILRHRMDS